MILTNKTTLRGLLAHLQSIARHRALLLGVASVHPHNTPKLQEARTKKAREIHRNWEFFRLDIQKVLGARLRPYSALPLPGSFTDEKVGFHNGTRDIFRITLAQLKKQCDKARLKDPSIRLMHNWNLKSHETQSEF